MKATGHCLIVAMTIFSWIAISNHCALRAFTTSDTTPNDCPFHSKPAKSQPQPTGTECCKIVRAVVFASAKSWTRDDAKFSDVDLRCEYLIVVSASHSALPLLLDTGPPGKTSFVELITSVRAHAPPIAV